MTICSSSEADVRELKIILEKYLVNAQTIGHLSENEYFS